jgi:hypothetical protein
VARDNEIIIIIIIILIIITIGRDYAIRIMSGTSLFKYSMIQMLSGFQCRHLRTLMHRDAHF